MGYASYSEDIIDRYHDSNLRPTKYIGRSVDQSAKIVPYNVLPTRTRRDITSRGRAVDSPDFRARSSLPRINKHLQLVFRKNPDLDGVGDTCMTDAQIRHAFSEVVTEVRFDMVEIVRTGFYRNRCKVAVRTLYDDVDPVDACVGYKGHLVGEVKNWLKNEPATQAIDTIEVFEWDDNPVRLIDSALGRQVSLQEIRALNPLKLAAITVSNIQIGKLIGVRGANIIAAMLVTGYDIGITGVDA